MRYFRKKKHSILFNRYNVEKKFFKSIMQNLFDKRRNETSIKSASHYASKIEDCELEGLKFNQSEQNGLKLKLSDRSNSNL